MLESEPESPVEKNLPQPKIGSKPSDLGSYLISIIWLIGQGVAGAYRAGGQGTP